MSLREDMWKYEQITGESAEHVPIIKLGAFLDGYDMGIKALEQQPCEDAIRRADAEALFRNARSKLNPSDYKTADEFNTRDLILLNAEQFIHLLPSVRPQEPKTGGWIPVSERLPEEMGTYMTTIDYGEHGLVTGQRYYYGRGLKWNDECVIAWMPLPDPYKAESEDKE